MPECVWARALRPRVRMFNTYLRFQFRCVCVCVFCCSFFRPCFSCFFRHDFFFRHVVSLQTCVPCLYCCVCVSCLLFSFNFRSCVSGPFSMFFFRQMLLSFLYCRYVSSFSSDHLSLFFRSFCLQTRFIL